MRKQMKNLITLALVAGLSVISATTVLAGQWKQDSIGWWWREDDGSYPINCWKWIDGNNDHVSECYYFDSTGYMLANTVTPDGYTVNADGAWIENGDIQTKVENIKKNMTGEITLNDSSKNLKEIIFYSKRGNSSLDVPQNGDWKYDGWDWYQYVFLEGKECWFTFVVPGYWGESLLNDGYTKIHYEVESTSDDSFNYGFDGLTEEEIRAFGPQ